MNEMINELWFPLIMLVVVIGGGIAALKYADYLQKKQKSLNN